MLSEGETGMNGRDIDYVVNSVARAKTEAGEDADATLSERETLGVEEEHRVAALSTE